MNYDVYLRLFQFKTKAEQKMICFVSRTLSEVVKRESNKNSQILKCDGSWCFRNPFDSKNISKYSYYSCWNSRIHWARKCMQYNSLFLLEEIRCTL